MQLDETAYSALGWRIVGDPKKVQVPDPKVSASSVICGGSQFTLPTGAYTWIAPDGAVRIFDVWGSPHCLTSGGAAIDAFAGDGSGFHLFYAGDEVTAIYARDGTLVQVDPYPVGTQGAYQSLVEDTNGNTLNWIYPNGTASYGLFPNPTDTLGRTPVALQISSGPTATANVLNSQNGTTPFAARMGPLGLLHPYFNGNETCTQSFPCQLPGEVLKNIALPDGSTYTFTYDCAPALNGDSTACTNPTTSQDGETYGEMTSMTLPSGGVINFGYTNFTDSNNKTNRWLSSISYGGSQWTYTPATGCGTNCQTVTVSRPSGVHEIYTFDTTTQSAALNTTIQYYNGAVTGSPALTIQNAWQSYPNGCGGSTLPYNEGGQFSHLTGTTFTVPSPAGNLLSQSTYVFDSFAESCGRTVTTGKLLSKSEYGFGLGSPGPLVRTTKISYLDDANPNYRTAGNIICLPSPAAAFCYVNAANFMNSPVDVQIQDGSGSVKAETKTSYDSTGLVSKTGIQNHDDSKFGTGNTLRANPTVIQKLVNGSLATVATITYDTTGQVTQGTDGNNSTISYSYADNFYNDASPAQNPPARFTPSQPTNAFLTQVTQPIIGAATYGYYYGSGKPAVSVDQNGADSYSHFLDSFDRPTHSFLPVTNGSRGWSLTTYGTGGTQTDTYTAITATTPSTSCTGCQHTQSILDSFQRQVQSVLFAPEGALNTAISYDSSGRTHTVSNPYKTTSDPTYGVTTYSLDSLGRPTLVAEADNSQIKLYYGSDVTAAGGTSQQCSTTTYGFGYPMLQIDEAGKKRQIWADALGRTIEADEPNSSGTLSVATCYAYDTLDNLTSVVQQGGTTDSTKWRTRTFLYDELSRLKSATEPESGTTAYTYDLNGNLLTKTSPAPNQTGSATVTISYCYDALNRMTSKSYTGQSCPMLSPTATYTYDVSSIDGYSTFSNPIGRLIKSQQVLASGVVANKWFDYDATGRVQHQFQCVRFNCGSYGSNPAWWVVTNTYDLAGDVTSYTDAFGFTFTQTFDNAGRPWQLTTNWVDATHPQNLYTVGTTSQSNYNPAGGINSALLGNGLTAAYAYNNRLQPCRMDWNSSAQSLTNCTTATPGTSMLDFSYAYNAGASNNGNVVSWSATGQQNFSRTYTYDSLNRLSTFSESNTSQPCGGLSWTYDAWGNRTDQTVTAGTCNSFHQSVNSQNRLVGPPYQYDAAGNLTYDGSHNYFYDADGHMIQADGTFGTCSTAWQCYNYDAAGQRVEKINGSSYLQYIYDAAGNVLAEWDTCCGLSRGYAYINGERVAEYGDGTTYFYQKDHLGSARLLTNTSQSVHDNIDYLPFGERQTGGLTATFQFTGEEFDLETGFHHFEARPYWANLGRFLSPDPLSGSPGNPQSWNRYAYVTNNPLNATDPAGTCDQYDTSDCPDFGSPDFIGIFSYDFNTGLPYDFSGIFDPFNIGGMFSPAPPPILPAGSPGQLFTGLWQGVYNQFVDLATTMNNMGSRRADISAAMQSQKYSIKSQNQLTGMGLSMGLPFLIPGGVQEKLAVEGLEAAEAAGKVPFAMGLDAELDAFAEARGATTWKQFSDPLNWRQGVLDKLADPETMVHFNLNGVDVWGGVQRAARGAGGATDWELLQIRQNPQFWGTLKFWRNGKIVANPFR